VTNQILLDALESLAVTQPVEADLLRKHFLDGLVMHAVANQLNVGESTAYRKQQEALKHLTLIVQTREDQARADYQTGLEKRLNLPPEIELIGVSDQLDCLMAMLTVPQPPWLICIEGLGGLGKTALANVLVRQPDLSSHFHDIAWVSAKQQDFLPGLKPEPSPAPALTVEALVTLLLEYFAPTVPLTQSLPQKQAALGQILKKAPYLVVVDNLETIVDYQTLLPFLHPLANPSKFVLTSRHSLSAYPDVFCHRLTELNHVDTHRLIRREARLRGISGLASASDEQLDRIYQVVGGNPLALKLVIGQLSVLPLDQVLDNLKQAQDQSTDQLYTYIYWQAWHLLNDPAQQTLLAMPLVQNGTLKQLLALTDLDPADLSQAIQQLARLSLLEIKGNMDERRYNIHRLTETFLLNEVIKWNTSV
jgi:hypothetical protein